MTPTQFCIKESCAPGVVQHNLFRPCHRDHIISQQRRRMPGAQVGCPSGTKLLKSARQHDLKKTPKSKFIVTFEKTTCEPFCAVLFLAMNPHKRDFQSQREYSW